MTMMQRDLVIVGAGPAGMAAAVAACRAGVDVTLIDENPLAGGQIYRQSPAALSSLDPPPDESAHHGKELVRDLDSVKDKIEWLPETNIWGYFPDRKLAVRSDGGWQMIEARQIILAPGAYEFVPPFPGWTLPGVMTPGAAQSMVKTMKVLPGRRALIAGSGPFLLVVARQLHAAGVEVVAVVETTRRRDFFSSALGLLASPKLLLQGRRYFQQLRKAKIPMFWGHLVTQAAGPEGGVEKVTIAPCSGNAGEKAGIDFKVDTLCVGYGFVPRTELAQMADCAMEYRESIGGWVPQVDESFETSVLGLRVVGDGGGVAGAVVAETEGKMAGLAAAHELGGLSHTAYQSQTHACGKQIAQMQKFRAALDHIYRLRPAVFDLAKPDTILCRCEEITRQEIEKGIQYGGTNISTLKVMTRAGMGPCQGKMCWPSVARLIASKQSVSVAEVGAVRVRPPIGCVEMSDLLDTLPLEKS